MSGLDQEPVTVAGGGVGARLARGPWQAAADGLRLQPIEGVPTALEQVYAEPELQTTRLETVWFRWSERQPVREVEHARIRTSGSPSGVSELVELALWIGFGLVVVYLVYRLRHRLRLPSMSRRATSPQPPKALVGHDIRPQSLPSDPLHEVLGLLDRGDLRLALSLLYRCTLSELVYVDGVAIPLSATEQEIVHATTGRIPESRHALLRRVTTAWQAIAYAHRSPPPTHLRRLAEHWAEVFQAAGPGTARSRS
ncbi:MAG: DUF4129 domain-containing protein [Gammaproteobacteria bacterium]|nr:DUF4129 domain-containing protein [Gammaproteobacteria bacterium]